MDQKYHQVKKSKDGYTLEMVNRLHDRIKAFFFRGKKKCNVTHYLQGYLALFQYSELHTMMIGSKDVSKMNS